MAAPTDILVTGGPVKEHAREGTLGAVDGDSVNTFNFALTNDVSGFYEIVNDELRVKAGTNLDFEAADTLEI